MSMGTFDEEMERHQTEWREAHVPSTEMGQQNQVKWPWILPSRMWTEGLWPGIQSSLPRYLRENYVQKHSGAHNLKSSWVMCANLYFPFRAKAEGRSLFAGFLQEHAAQEVRTVDAIELEYAEPSGSTLHPACLLGETEGSRGAGQTSPDLGVLLNDGHGLALVESKFTEHSFYDCSAGRWGRPAGRPRNPDSTRCDDLLAVVNDYASQCHQTAWGRRYWERLVSTVDKGALAKLPRCPAAKNGYQLFRQHALAEGIARSGKYDLVVSVVAVDERNDELDKALHRSKIDGGMRGWGKLFPKAKARFAVFTHQQWVEWVRQHDTVGQWSDWLKYVQARYDLGS